MNYIEIPDGWSVDQEKLKALLLVPSKTYSIGNKFKRGDKIYLLCAAAPGQVSFVNIETGKRLSGPIAVRNSFNIQWKELEILLESYIDDFELIE